MYFLCRKILFSKVCVRKILYVIVAILTAAEGSYIKIMKGSEKNGNIVKETILDTRQGIGNKDKVWFNIEGEVATSTINTTFVRYHKSKHGKHKTKVTEPLTAFSEEKEGTYESPHESPVEEQQERPTHSHNHGHKHTWQGPAYPQIVGKTKKHKRFQSYSAYGRKGSKRESTAEEQMETEEKTALFSVENSVREIPAKVKTTRAIGRVGKKLYTRMIHHSVLFDDDDQQPEQQHTHTIPKMTTHRTTRTKYPKILMVATENNMAAVKPASNYNNLDGVFESMETKKLAQQLVNDDLLIDGRSPKDSEIPHLLNDETDQNMIDAVEFDAGEEEIRVERNKPVDKTRKSPNLCESYNIPNPLTYRKINSNDLLQDCINKIYSVRKYIPVNNDLKLSYNPNKSVYAALNRKLSFRTTQQQTHSDNVYLSSTPKSFSIINLIPDKTFTVPKIDAYHDGNITVDVSRKNIGSYMAKILDHIGKTKIDTTRPKSALNLKLKEMLRGSVNNISADVLLNTMSKSDVIDNITDLIMERMYERLLGPNQNQNQNLSENQNNNQTQNQTHHKNDTLNQNQIHIHIHNQYHNPNQSQIHNQNPTEYQNKNHDQNQNQSQNHGHDHNQDHKQDHNHNQTNNLNHKHQNQNQKETTDRKVHVNTKKTTVWSETGSPSVEGGSIEDSNQNQHQNQKKTTKLKEHATSKKTPTISENTAHSVERDSVEVIEILLDKDGLILEKPVIIHDDYS